jgi:site-specific recombinase XerD
VVELAQVSRQDLEAFLAEMDRRGYRASTRNRKAHALKSWFAYLEECGVTGENLARKLVPPAERRSEPRFLSAAEYKELQLACRNHPRDAAMVELFLQTGMRLSELARLTLDDVELPRRISRHPDDIGTVRVIRKGGQVATIPLNHKACRAVKSWLEARPDVEHRALFVTKFGTAMQPRAIQQTIQKYLKEVGIAGASVHTLRHTMATHHVAQGTDLRTVQETLGHASLETTALYVSLAKQVQRKALQEHAL